MAEKPRGDDPHLQLCHIIRCRRHMASVEDGDGSWEGFRLFYACGHLLKILSNMMVDVYKSKDLSLESGFFD